MKLTVYAGRIIDNLIRLQLMLMSVVGDNNSFNKRITESRRGQREKTLAYFREHAVGGQMPEITFEGPELGQENADYTSFLNEKMGRMVLCDAVDLYHWYLKQVVMLIFNANPELLPQWAKELKIKNQEELDAFGRGEDRDKLLTKWLRGAEWKTRTLVHDYFNIPLKDDLGLLVETRNCIVHGLGLDTDGTLETRLSSNTRLGFCVLGAELKVGFNGGYNSVEIVVSDVSIIDQMLAHKFSLPTTPHIPPKITRICS